MYYFTKDQCLGYIMSYNQCLGCSERMIWKEWAKDMNINLMEYETTMINILVKKFTTSVVIMEWQVDTTIN